jgi:hypothetical protein
MSKEKQRMDFYAGGIRLLKQTITLTTNTVASFNHST